MGILINVILIGAVAFFLYKRLVPAKGIRNISTSELNTELKNKEKQFIDVRTPSEFKANHIKEFKNIPLYDLTKKASELSKDKEVFLICQSGMRSSNASKVLKKMGFKNITNVKGGMSAWR
ncbi:rhodanese-like domain-containing protein [Psychrobacillus sp. FSL K6-1415]|uniref:rhodanese-like domain-containing protein n=1 Tax=Psychrobacillus sp. FSL K6-1415 TaxID=2921544 RepID=UPI0030F700BB